jgi:hypothetical protein
MSGFVPTFGHYRDDEAVGLWTESNIVSIFIDDSFSYNRISPQASAGFDLSLTASVLQHNFNFSIYLLTYLLTYSMVQDII